MAKRIVNELVDDRDGSLAVVTVRFGIDGLLYEIDLSAANATHLRAALATFAGAASRRARHWHCRSWLVAAQGRGAGNDRDVVRCQFGAPIHMWRQVHDRLAADHERLRQETADLRTRANIPAAVSVLRVPRRGAVDGVVWLPHRHRLRRLGSPRPRIRTRALKATVKLAGA